MKHKMIGCSEECLELACCDFCIYVAREPVYDEAELINVDEIDVPAI